MTNSYFIVTLFCCSLTVPGFMGWTAPIITYITENVLFGCHIKILNRIRNSTMLTWSNHSTTGEHFTFLCDYKPRINVWVVWKIVILMIYGNMTRMDQISLTFLIVWHLDYSLVLVIQLTNWLGQWQWSRTQRLGIGVLLRTYCTRMKISRLVTLLLILMKCTKWRKTVSGKDQRYLWCEL